MLNSMIARDRLAETWLEATTPNVGSESLQSYPFHGFPDEQSEVAFFVAKDNLQDSGEALYSHAKKGFTDDMFLGYIELWGVMQATVIHQDAIAELHGALGGQRSFKPENLPGAWGGIRHMRHILGGHPNRTDRPKSEPVRRVSVPRGAPSYNGFEISVRVPGGRKAERVDLRNLLKEYDELAADLIDEARKMLEVQITATKIVR